ncbi:hypothetical protein [Xenorhabdus hominickii]|uniref:Uncharacterized protein n=1 Tax=Xenorhabdus hominickii TaxID=351679 RepID=A0A2G0QCY6_XENHO|nr:hypothetical protein [Xenorhabdus hominickii]AOM41209.1 hypothetical protein A9255_11835 [Xenorhabdus hominickii]PHM55542.1 hypothetical protein Xhom_02288 [Xenorhabdus hominickii]PHM57093.1 hypothetical protein Xhom_00047 [Xenorhabdus hominickii]
MIYIVISLLMLIPFFFILKWLLLSKHIHHNAAGIMFAVAVIAFHMYIFRFDQLPILHVAMSHKPIVFYGAIVIALLHGVIYSVCFNRYYGKAIYDKR